MENEKRNKSENGVFPYIPYEMLVHILLRVPATSLTRLKLVSKSWCALFSSPEFITAHVKINRELKIRLFISAFGPTTCKLFSRSLLLGGHYSLNAASSSQNDPAVVTASSGSKTNIKHGDYMMCCCDGLICFFKKPNHIQIWNPTTRKFRNLPLLKPKKPGCLEFIGFGYYEPANDYKVLALQCPHDDDHYYYEDNIVLQIYSLNTHSWETVKYYCYFATPTPSSIIGVFLNNKPYWLESNIAYGICSFNFDSSKFEQIEEPHHSIGSCGGGDEYARSLRVLDGHLCVGYDKYYSMELWLVKKEMNAKEYTWMKFVSINHSLYFDVLPMKFGIPFHLSHVLDVLPISHKGKITIIMEDKYGKHWLMIYDSHVSSQGMVAIPTNAEVQLNSLIYVPSLISI